MILRVPTLPGDRPARSGRRGRTPLGAAHLIVMSMRKRIVERAAVAITNYLDPVRDPDKRHDGDYDEFDVGQAREVVDAVLPLVRTADALKEIPLGTLLLVVLSEGCLAVEWDGAAV